MPSTAGPGRGRSSAPCRRRGGAAWSRWMARRYASGSDAGPGRHLLAALDHAHGVVLGQVDVQAKTNEIPMLPVLLERIELSGATSPSTCRTMRTWPRARHERRFGHAATENLGHTAFLERLLDVEVTATGARRQASLERFASLPSPFRLEDFDFDAQPGIDKKLVHELATLRFPEDIGNQRYQNLLNARRDTCAA